MWCSKCKEEISDNAVFCPYCGEKQTTNGGENIEKKEKGNIFKRKYIIALVGVIVLIVCLFSCGKRNENNQEGSGSVAELFEKPGRISQEDADREMEYYYFDSYISTGQEYDGDMQTTYTYYDVTFNREYCSYNGSVTLTSYYYGEDSGYWDSYLEYNDCFEWSVAGKWAAGAEDMEGAESDKRAIEVEFFEINESQNSVSFAVNDYIGTSRKDVIDHSTGQISAQTVTDYTGRDYLTKGPSFSSTDGTTDSTKNYDAPTLSFEFDVDDSEYAIRVFPEEVTFSFVGYGNRGYGTLYNNSCIVIYENEYGWPQLERNSN